MKDPEFAGRIEKLLGNEADEYFTQTEDEPYKAIRVNTLKTSVQEAIKRLEGNGIDLEEIPWTSEGRYITGNITDTIDYFQGYYYIQDPSSMIPPIILDPKPGEVILDMTASPGGKTTHIAALMENTGLLMANEGSIKRIPTLRFNLSKYGVTNTIVTRMDATQTIKTDIRFDKILLDAPCSGEGLFTTNKEACRQWSLKKVRKCANIQAKMIENAASLLKEEGVLVYSTCTLAPEENEAIINSILDTGFKVDKINLNGLDARPGITHWEGSEYDKTVKDTLRIYPHLNKSMGFYVARLVK